MQFLGLPEDFDEQLSNSGFLRSMGGIIRVRQDNPDLEFRIEPSRLARLSSFELAWISSAFFLGGYEGEHVSARCASHSIAAFPALFSRNHIKKSATFGRAPRLITRIEITGFGG